MLITVEHIRAAHLCGRGLVNRMKRVGMTDEEIMNALQNGMPEEQVRAYGDAQMNAVIELAHRMEAEKKANG
jgi:hypothetical protein